MTKKEYMEYLQGCQELESVEKLLEYYQNEIPDEAEVISGTEGVALNISKEKKDYYLTGTGISGYPDVLHFQERRKTDNHNDWLSLSYQAENEKILTRCNITIDDRPIEEPNKAEAQPFILKQKYSFMQHTYTGYMSLQNGVLIKRKVVTIGTRLILISDDFYAIGIHDYQQLWCFDDHIEVQPSANLIRCSGHDVQMDLYNLSGCTTHNHTIFRMPEYRRGKYQHFENPHSMLVRKTGSAFCSMLTLIHIYGRAKKRKTEDLLEMRKLVPESIFIGSAMLDSSAEAIEVELGNKRYIIFVGHQDVFGMNDMIRAGDCSGFGNVIVFEASAEGKPANILY